MSAVKPSHVLSSWENVNYFHYVCIKLHDTIRQTIFNINTLFLIAFISERQTILSVMLLIKLWTIVDLREKRPTRSGVTFL